MLRNFIIAPLIFSLVSGAISMGLAHADDIGLHMPDLPQLGPDDGGDSGHAHASRDQKDRAGHNLRGLDRSADPADCRFSHRVVRVKIDPSRYPESADHIDDVRASGEYPRIWHLDRTGADHNRELSLAGIPTVAGHDRDELPPASSFEGGAGADVRSIPSADNRGSGSSLGSQLAPYCSGQAFVMTTPGG